MILKFFKQKIHTLPGLLLLMLSLFSACIPVQQTPAGPTQTPSLTSSPIPTTPLPSPMTPFLTSTLTLTPGPSPTSTQQPALESHTWRAAPIMIEAAMIGSDLMLPFQYTPFFVLFGDGIIVIRSCDSGNCRYLQTHLSEVQLCQLINAIDRTGFLDVNPQSIAVPEGSGKEIRLSIHIYGENNLQIPDLDRWLENPDWYQTYVGCINCYTPPRIDPAVLDLYRLLTTYQTTDLRGLVTDRLAIWLTQPVILGTPQPWPEDLTPLKILAENSTCPGNPSSQQALILERDAASAVADLLANQNSQPPIFTDGELTLQVHSRWLLPYEMPQSCERPAGLYPPAGFPEIIWQCEPAMGAIPTATATITPTPSITPTPLR